MSKLASHQWFPNELLVYLVEGDVGVELGKRLNAGDEACRRAVEVVFQADKRALSNLRSRNTEPTEA